MMKLKTIKKAIAMFSLVAVSVCTFGMNVTVAQEPPITTSFTKNASNDGMPIVEVKWEMNTDRTDFGSDYLGTDDYNTPGAQFDPSGVYLEDKTFAVCAIVSDPDGIADIDRVASFVHYPDGIWLGPDHEANRQGCGEQIGNEFELVALEKYEGIRLFCDRIHDWNNNLPKWQGDVEAYEKLCSDSMDEGQRGMLRKDTAMVYCGEKTISYEDPNGNYKTTVKAQDTGGNLGILQNYFTYVEMTAYDVDFTSVSYGDVKLNVRKDISGDNTYGTVDMPTVRNVGNTRLNMQVKQDDMGLGKMGDGPADWNVKYYARVGDIVPITAQSYYPEIWITLDDSLNLSETNEMDFSIEVFQFLPEHSDVYSGTMTLDATKADHLVCPS